MLMAIVQEKSFFDEKMTVVISEGNLSGRFAWAEGKDDNNNILNNTTFDGLTQPIVSTAAYR